MEAPEAYKASIPTVYEARAAGREFCMTQGSEHYHQAGPEPMELLISCGLAEGYCLGSVIMYASRYQRTRELGDLRKAVDMLHILCGIELSAKEKSNR